MKCAKARKHISDYIDGDLDAGKVYSLGELAAAPRGSFTLGVDR